jgi:hypothetical protein
MGGERGFLNQEPVVSRLFTIAERDVAAIDRCSREEEEGTREGEKEGERERESFGWCFLVLVFLHGCFERISSRR